jgi:hypothetical protein
MDPVDAILVHDKWGTHIVRADDGTLPSAALKLLSERVEQGFWYDWPDDAADKAKAIVDRGDGAAAWDFLEDRRDFEYEWVEAKRI